jgi:carbonic anhydrase/acetyltransferase-like protein (isoleucine patch superfamily)
MIQSFEDKIPKIASSAYVHEMSCIIGDVEIGENCAIFAGAIIRGDLAPIKVGHNTAIEDNTVVHSGAGMEIGDYVTIGHSVVVHGVKIGNNCLIGNNATILDDSKIGNFCVIAAGCVVSPGVEIPDNSMVFGVPGVIKGRVSEPMKDLLKNGYHYHEELIRRYKNQKHTGK